jgi:replication factor C subunit 1
MFTTKYKPQSLDEFIGSKELIIRPFIRWLLEWNSENKKTKCALISGVNGCGKSLLAELVLETHDYNIIHLNSDEERNKENIQKTIKPLLKTVKSLNGQDNALVVSDIDSSAGDYGFIASLVECIKITMIPIILICDDRYSQNIKPVIPFCYDVKLPKPGYDDVYKLIYKIVTTEGLKIGKSAVDKLFRQSNGDIRHILNTLQMNLKKTADTSKNIQSANIFDTCGKLMSVDTSFEDKYDTFWLARDMHPLMVQENYISNTLTTRDDLKRLENISSAASAMSDMDIIDSVFDWELEPYIAANTIHSTMKCSKRGQIKFPQYLGKISTINKNKREKLDYHFVKFKKNKK